MLFMKDHSKVIHPAEKKVKGGSHSKKIINDQELIQSDPENIYIYIYNR